MMQLGLRLPRLRQRLLSLGKDGRADQSSVCEFMTGRRAAVQGKRWSPAHACLPCLDPHPAPPHLLQRGTCPPAPSPSPRGLRGASHHHLVVSLHQKPLLSRMRFISIFSLHKGRTFRSKEAIPDVINFDFVCEAGAPESDSWNVSGPPY